MPAEAPAPAGGSVTGRMLFQNPSNGRAIVQGAGAIAEAGEASAHADARADVSGAPVKSSATPVDAEVDESAQHQALLLILALAA